MNELVEQTDLIDLYTKADLAIDDARAALRRPDHGELHELRLRIAGLRDRCVDRIVADTRRLDHIDAVHQDRRHDRAYRELQRQLAIATDTHNDLRDVDAQICEFVVSDAPQEPTVNSVNKQTPGRRTIAAYAFAAIAALLAVPCVDQGLALVVSAERSGGAYEAALAIGAVVAVLAGFVLATASFKLNQIRARGRGSAYAYTSSLILIGVWLAGVLAWVILGGSESLVPVAAAILRAGAIAAAVGGLMLGMSLARKAALPQSS